MIRCVAFDFDGTLVDSNAIKRRTFFQVMAAHDPEGALVTKVLDETRPGDRYAVTRELARLLDSRGELSSAHTPAEWARKWAAEYGRRCEDAVSRCPEIPGAAAALAWLAEHDIPSYVNSATPEPSLRRTVERRSMSARFRLVLGGPASKLANLKRIRAHAGCGSDGALMVGDGEDDRNAAAAIGCPFVGVAPSGLGRFAGEPAVRIADLGQLPDVILHLCARTP